MDYRYIRHRIAVAGSSPRVELDEDACARICELSGGVLAIVNVLCTEALRKGYRRSASVIDAPLVDSAAVALAGLMLVGAAGALFVFRDEVARTIRQWEQVPAPPGGPVLRPVPLPPIPTPVDPAPDTPAESSTRSASPRSDNPQTPPYV